MGVLWLLKGPKAFSKTKQTGPKEYKLFHNFVGMRKFTYVTLEGFEVLYISRAYEGNSLYFFSYILFCINYSQGRILRNIYQ